MYHDTLWIAVSASAPVIALAAVVALGDAAGEAYRSTEWNIDHPQIGSPPQAVLDRQKQLSRRFSAAQMIVVIVCLLNTLLQAGVLGTSLASLAGHTDYMPAAAAVVFEVLGLVAITVGGLAAVAVRGTRRRMIRLRAGHSEVGTDLLGGISAEFGGGTGGSTDYASTGYASTGDGSTAPGLAD